MMSTVADSLAAKLHPTRFTAMSGKMAAIVGCILGEEFTEPRITGLMVTSDGGLLAASSEDPLFDDFLGTEEMLLGNWTRLLDLAGLAPEERALAERRYAEVVRHA